MDLRSLFILLSSVFVFALPETAGAAQPSAAGALADLYRDVLQNPTDSKVNLRYARMAEVEGKLRLALAAYERVVLNDPQNREGQAGFMRVRRLLEPPTTQVRVELGTGLDTNPLNLHSGYETKPVFSANASLRDERILLAQRWRTLINLAGNYPLDTAQLLYGYAGVQTGPLIDASPSLTLYPALGGGVATLDRNLFYTEGNASMTFEGRFGGAFQALRIRGGFRSYGENMTADQGFFTDAVGKLAVPSPLGAPGVLLLSPWLRWSGISGAVRNDLTGDGSPGRFAEWGLELGYYIRPVPDLTLGANITGRQRLFLDAMVIDERREDNYVSPGLSAVRSNVLACACDIELNYHYRVNNSNDSDADYHGHAATVSFATHF